MRRDYLFVGLIWLVVTVIGELLLPGVGFIASMPATEQGILIDAAFGSLLAWGWPVFAFVIVVLVYSVLRFRVGDSDDMHGAPVRTNTAVWIAWLIITVALAAIILFNPGIKGVQELRALSTDHELLVEVVAEQWNWTFTYPEYGVTVESADELVLPVDTDIRFEITGTDVIHSFWIPAFRIKQDAVPGHTTVIHASTTRTGDMDDDPNFRVQCAELCGTGHARMFASVVVLEEAEFEEWVAGQ